MSFRELVKIIGDHGVCVSAENPDAWFRELPRGPRARDIQRLQARSACGACPVRTECLTVAVINEIDTEMSWGIWGGVCAGDRQDVIESARACDRTVVPDVDDLVERLLPLANMGTATVA